MLTRQGAENAEPRDKPYMLPDSDGLYLRVFPSGTKKWVVRLYANDKVSQHVLGVFPEMGISDARKARTKLKQEQKACDNSVTLGAIAARWLAEYSSTLSQASQYNHRLYLSYLPSIIDVSLSRLRRRDLIAALKMVQAAHSYETARRVAVVLGQIYDYAVDAGVLEESPALRLSSSLSAPEEEKRGTHFSAILDDAGIGRLLRALQCIKSPTVRRALMFIAYTFPRSGELRTATWYEMDIGAAVWNIPAEHTKRRKAHVIPLSRQALAILQEQRATGKGRGYVFPSATKAGAMLSKSTLILTLGDLRSLPDDIRPEKMTVHGFRAMASTLLNRSGLWRTDAIERQLAHSPENEVRAAYNREDYMQERVKMMQWYADKLDGLKDTE